MSDSTGLLMVEDQIQKESNEKPEPFLETPMWYLKISSKFVRNNKRVGFLLVYLIAGVYLLIPLFTSTASTIARRDYLPIAFYGIIFFIYFLALFILQRYTFKGFKIELREKLAFYSFSLYNSLKKISYGKEIEPFIKQSINNFTRVLKESDNSKLIWGEEDLLNPIEECIKDLDRINYLVKKPSENPNKLEEITSDLYELSIQLNNSNKIKTSENIAKFKKLANHLEEIKVQKLTDKIARLKQFVIDYFPAYGFVIVVVLGIGIAISWFTNTALSTVLSTIFVAVLIFWLQSFLKENKA